MLAEMAQWLVEMILGYGYFGIYLLMSIESSFIPFPSEIVLIPAGYLASQGQMDMSLIIAVSLAGSLTGAFINYYLAYFIGRSFLETYGKYFFISNSALSKMDSYFEKHGHISTFIGRLIPGIRQLISIPAGLAKMNIKVFSLYSALGALIWSIVSVVIGYTVGENQDLIKTYLHQITLVTIGTLLFIAALYYALQRRKAKA